MIREEAIGKALDYIHAASLDLGPIIDVKYLDGRDLDDQANNCPPDLLKTLHNVRKHWRNQWVITFRTKEVPGQVSCPETRLVCVLETGEVTVFPSP
jgi:hypothetical protein